jgi:ADP-ribose pyrophosphatase
MKKWKIIKETNVSPSKWYPLFKQKVKLPNGETIDDYYVSKLGDAVSIVAITSDKKIILTDEYKQGIRKNILNIPSGRVDKNNILEEEARRELYEETGYTTKKKLKYLGYIYFSPVKDTSVIHGYLATDVIKKDNSQLDETEQIEVELHPVNKLNKMIRESLIKKTDAISFIYLAKLKFPDYFN